MKYIKWLRNFLHKYTLYKINSCLLSDLRQLCGVISIKNFYSLRQSCSKCGFAEKPLNISKNPPLLGRPLGL